MCLADKKILLAGKCFRTGVSVRRSAIQHARAGNGLFASQNFGENGVAGLYNALLAYVDLARELRLGKQYEEGFMEATAQWFR